MWFFRGAQSALFYYLACTPCVDAKYRRSRKKEAKRARKEKNARPDTSAADEPQAFSQPIPFTTNPGWYHEVSLGPSPASRKRRYRTGGYSPTGEYQFPWTSNAHAHPQGWSWIVQQREDEVLWGQEKNNGRDRADRPCISAAPGLRDNHPPIVSGPKSRADVRWMLQPPPSAKVMAGKEPPSRCPPPSCRTLDSHGSRIGGFPWTDARPGSERSGLLAPVLDYQKQEPPGKPSHEGSHPNGQALPRCVSPRALPITVDSLNIHEPSATSFPLKPAFSILDFCAFVGSSLSESVNIIGISYTSKGIDLESSCCGYK